MCLLTASFYLAWQLIVKYCWRERQSGGWFVLLTDLQCNKEERKELRWKLWSPELTRLQFEIPISSAPISHSRGTDKFTSSTEQTHVASNSTGDDATFNKLKGKPQMLNCIYRVFAIRRVDAYSEDTGSCSVITYKIFYLLVKNNCVSCTVSDRLLNKYLLIGSLSQLKTPISPYHNVI